MREEDMRNSDIELTELQKADLERLRNQSDDEIDTSDIPETLDWSNAQRGVFYRPEQQQVTLNLDVNVVSWFKEHAGEDGLGYETEINQTLRKHVARQRGEAA